SSFFFCTLMEVRLLSPCDALNRKAVRPLHEHTVSLLRTLQNTNYKYSRQEVSRWTKTIKTLSLRKNTSREPSTNAFLNDVRGERGDLVSVLALLLYSLKFLSLPL